MPASVMPAVLAPLSIDVWFDIVCPWCLIGVRRLEAALAGRHDLQARVSLRPFRLHAKWPADGMSWRSFQAVRGLSDALLAAAGHSRACKTMVELLALAHDRTCEAELAEAFEADVDAGRLPDLAFLSAYFGPGPESVPLFDVEVVPLAAYYELVAVATVTATPALQVAS